MKNLKSISVIALLLISTILFVNCEKESVEIQEQSLTPELIGKLHNEALDNIFKKESEFNFNTNEDGLKQQIIEKNSDFLSNKIPDFTNYNINMSEIGKSMNLLNSDEFINKNFRVSNKIKKKSYIFQLEDSNIFEKINFIQESGLILETDKKILDNLFDAYQRHVEGLITNDELLVIAEQIKLNYSNISNNNYSSNNVLITKSIIEICTNSIKWFAENKDILESKSTTKNKRVPVAPIVAADAVGAITGIATGIIASGIIKGTNKSADGTSIVVGAVLEAAFSSAGAAVRVAGWLSKLF